MIGKAIGSTGTREFFFTISTRFLGALEVLSSWVRQQGSIDDHQNVMAALSVRDANVESIAEASILKHPTE